MTISSRVVSLCVAACCASLFILAPGPSHADGPQGNTFGIGVSIGNPSSITGKYYFSDSNFLDFHVGAYRLYDRRYYEDALFLAADYVWEVYKFHEDDTLSIPFYIGAGGGLVVDPDQDCDIVRNGECIDLDRADYFQFAIGPRMPIGAALQFQEVPLEVFLEFSPSLYFLFYDDGYREDVDVDVEFVNVALGGRFYF